MWGQVWRPREMRKEGILQRRPMLMILPEPLPRKWDPRHWEIAVVRRDSPADISWNWNPPPPHYATVGAIGPLTMSWRGDSNKQQSASRRRQSYSRQVAVSRLKSPVSHIFHQSVTFLYVTDWGLPGLVTGFKVNTERSMSFRLADSQPQTLTVNWCGGCIACCWPFCRSVLLNVGLIPRWGALLWCYCCSFRWNLNNSEFHNGQLWMNTLFSFHTLNLHWVLIVFKLHIASICACWLLRCPLARAMLRLFVWNMRKKSVEFTCALNVNIIVIISRP